MHPSWKQHSLHLTCTLCCARKVNGSGALRCTAQKNVNAPSVLYAGNETAHILRLRSSLKVSPESGALMGAHVSTENVPRYRERSNSAVHPEGRPNKSYKSGEFGIQ